MAPTKLACLNAGDNAEYTYTGKENTPQGLGYAAGPEMVGKMMKGRDGAVYMVIMKNREKTWKKIPEDMAERMQKEMPLLTKAVSEVRSAEEPAKPAEETQVEEPAMPVEEIEVKPTEEPAKEKKARKPRAKKEAEKPAEEIQVEGEEKPAEEPVKEKKARKPRAKKEAEGEEAVKEKKERKPRAPTEYNKFLGEKITELRISEPGKKSTEYMQMAIALWREKKAEA